MGTGQTPRVRPAAIPDDAILVVRGNELDRAVLVADAVRFHRRFEAWGRFDVSAFVATDHAEVDVLCETKLRQWATVVTYQRSALESAGVEVVATFRVPDVTLAHTELTELADRMARCEHRLLLNPYHEPDRGPLEAR